MTCEFEPTEPINSALRLSKTAGQDLWQFSHGCLESVAQILTRNLKNGFSLLPDPAPVACMLWKVYRQDASGSTPLPYFYIILH